MVWMVKEERAGRVIRRGRIVVVVWGGVLIDGHEEICENKKGLRLQDFASLLWYHIEKINWQNEWSVLILDIYIQQSYSTPYGSTTSQETYKENYLLHLQLYLGVYYSKSDPIQYFRANQGNQNWFWEIYFPTILPAAFICMKSMNLRFWLAASLWSSCDICCLIFFVQCVSNYLNHFLL